MENVFITGVGLKTAIIDSLAELQQKNISEYPILQEKDIEMIANVKRTFLNKNIIAREDRAMLNDIAKLAIDSACEAFALSEKNGKFSEKAKEEFSIFMANELPPITSKPMEMLINKHCESDGFDWKYLGKIKDFLSPLDMLRLLSTNPLYHISKLFELHGGGYPVRRMSMSSLCALEEAFLKLRTYGNTSIVVAAGDLTSNINQHAFEKMGIIRKDTSPEDGIVPSFGSASVILESKSALELRKNKVQVYCEVIDIKTLFKTDNVNKNDWIKLFNLLIKNEMKNLVVVSYDNGVKSIANEEKLAIEDVFPAAQIINYKQNVGYTGKPNSIIDLVLALSDRRIAPNSYVLINGVGMLAGLGCLLIRKVAHA